MVTQFESWDGNEWEQYATQLLFLRHPNGDFQETPSAYRGDLGIDGYARSCGRAYQCYAAEEPLPHKARHEKQRDKIRDDTAKLMDRADEVAGMLGSTVLHCWTLVVPIFTSTPLLTYCSTRTGELCRAGLPFLAADFTITIEQRSAFGTEEAQLLREAREIARLPDPPLADDAAERFAQDTPSFLQHLNQKLSSHVEASRLGPYLEDLLRAYLRGKNLEDYLQSSFPPLYEVLQDVRRRRERSLSGLSALLDNDPMRRLQTVVSTVEADMDERLGSVRGVDRDVLTEALVVDWLGRCPLRLD